MKFRTFHLRMIQTNIRKYFLFLLSAIFSMSTFFIFINLWFTDSFQANTNNQMHTLMMIAAIITILFSIFIISYVHWHMLRERMKGFTVLLSYGMRLRELSGLIVMETFMIYALSLCLAYLTGGLFSRLFFMISVKLLSIEEGAIAYQLTYESFIITAIVFFIIFTTVLGMALFRISKKDLVKLSKSKQEVELTKNGNLFAGILGSLILIGSMLALYLHNRSTTENISEWILSSALFCLIGLYLVISHFSRLIYISFKRNSRSYYSHILEASEFAMGYRGTRKTLFMMTLLTFGIILFTGVTYTLYAEAYKITDRENPQDLFFQEIEAANVFHEEELEEIITASEAGLKESKELRFLYMKAPELQLNNWRTSRWVPVVSESEFNSCFQTSYTVNSGEAIQILFESEIDRDFVYFDQEIHLVNADKEYHLLSREPIYDKILHRYAFTQALLLIVNDKDYQEFQSAATKLEKGKLFLYQLKNWKESKELKSEINSKVYGGYEVLAVKEKEVYDELISRYGYSHLQVRSKISFYEVQSMQGSFSLFIMGFVSILFSFCILITYNFKVFMNAAEDRIRLRKLDGIGMLQKEKEKLIKIRIRLLLFVPTILGSAIGITWSSCLNFKKLLEIDLPNSVLFKNALFVGGILFVIMLLFYKFLKSSYLQRMRVVKEY